MPVLGPLVAYVQTPRSASGRLVEKTFETLIENAITAGVDAISVLGSVGGAAYMPRALRKKVIAKAVAVADGRVPIFAGVGALTTAEVGLNLADAASVGASGALLQPMSYQPLLPHEVMFLYERANELTNIPLWVYNNPATTRHVFSTEELASIAALENVSGFKDRAANAPELKHRIEYIAASLPNKKAERFNWGFSGETKGALVLGSGGHTWHSALAGIMPKLCVELAQAAVAGREDSDVAAFAVQMQRVLNPLTVTMTQYGGIRVAHAIAQQQGLDAGDLPQPLRPLPPAVHGIVHLAMESIDRSLMTLQQELAQGGIAAASTVKLDAEAPTLGTLSGQDRTRRARNSSRKNATAPHMHASGSPDTAQADGTHAELDALAHSMYESVQMRVREYPTTAFEVPPAALSRGEDFDQETALLRSIELLNQEPAFTTTATPDGVGVVRRSILNKGPFVSSGKINDHDGIVGAHGSNADGSREEELGQYGGHGINPKSSTPNGAFGRLRSSENAPSTPPAFQGYVPDRLEFTDNQENRLADPDQTMVLHLDELPQPEPHTLGLTSSSTPVPPVPPATGNVSTHAKNPVSGEIELEDVPMTRSAARAARDALRVQREHQLENSGLTLTEGVQSASQTVEVSLEHLFSQSSPTRVSAKARIQNEATRAELEHAAEHFLLSGDPEIDQTRINMERIDVPLLGDGLRDSSNYVPRRARADSE